MYLKPGRGCGAAAEPVLVLRYRGAGCVHLHSSYGYSSLSSLTHCGREHSSMPWELRAKKQSP